MIARTQPRLGRNEPCWCGSGVKYKACHLDADAAKEHAQREQARAAVADEHDGHERYRCARYQPQTHKMPAMDRPDFIITVRNLASAGEGSWLHVDGPIDLGRDQPAVDAALEFLERHGVAPDFRLDPSPALVAATQELLDRMSGRGVFRVKPSGARLRGYGRTEVVPTSDGVGFVAYLSGRSDMDGVVRLLLAAAAADAQTLGVADGLLADVWPVARVAREIVVAHLALPPVFLEHGEALVRALLRATSNSSSEALPAGALLLRRDLPYLIGLREAALDPERQLEGMGLRPGSVQAISAIFQEAAAGPAWLRRLAELAPEDWDTPDGYRSWRDAARALLEGTDELQSERVNEGPAAVGEQTQATPSGPLPSSPVAAAPGVVTEPSPPARSVPPSVFADIDRVAEEYTRQREAVQVRLASTLDRREDFVHHRRDLEAAFGTLAEEEATLEREQTEAKERLEASADLEARARHTAIIEVLIRESERLGEIAVAWSETLSQREDRDDATLADAEQAVREYEDMERRGLVVMLPDGVRQSIEGRVTAARATLREVFGGRGPVTLAVIVAAVEEDDAVTLSVGLPFAGTAELMPGALQTAVAIAVAEAVVDTVRSMPESDVAGLEHASLSAGACVLRVRFADLLPVTADDCAQYFASLLSDIARRSVPLREAGVAIDARVFADLEVDD